MAMMGTFALIAGLSCLVCAPLTSAPLLPAGEKLTGAGESGTGAFGSSVALSADGQTALVGAPNDDNGAGAAWIFTRSGSTWTQQGEKLLGAGESGYDEFGASVALSADGSTAVIGGWLDNGDRGAVWIFTRSGSTWTQQGEKLTAPEEGESGYFGISVAVSADGSTILVGGGGPSFEVGAAWVFTRSGASWGLQAELTGSNEVGQGEFGDSVALSGNGDTALIGGPHDDYLPGAVWTFTRSGSDWHQLGEKLTVGGESESIQFGESVALSADGATALIGAPARNEAWLFGRSGSGWVEQEKLSGPGNSKFGERVTLSANGDSALVGANFDREFAGAAWAFTRSGSTWLQSSEELTSGERVELSPIDFGAGVALSEDGDDALVGGFGSDFELGAVWAFARPHPLVLTGAASAITQNAATLNATVNPEGVAVEDCELEYGTTTTYGSSIPCLQIQGSGNSPVEVSAGITGLVANTIYHFRLTATNEVGTVQGEDRTFRTLPQSPTVLTGAALQVTQSAAMLNATVDPNGGAVEGCLFEYGRTSSYGSSAPCAAEAGAGEDPVAVSTAMTDLDASTDYHFRIVARNPGGIGYGEDHEFTTATPPSPSTPPQTQSPPSTPRIESTMTWRFGSFPSYTVVLALAVHAVPAGSHLEVLCHGRGCPFGDHAVALRPSPSSHCRHKCTTHSGTDVPTVITGLFKGRRLSPGAGITVKITRPKWIGKSFAFAIRRHREPLSRIVCLAPGTNEPDADC
jgi:lipocalin